MNFLEISEKWGYRLVMDLKKQLVIITLILAVLFLASRLRAGAPEIHQPFNMPTTGCSQHTTIAVSQGHPQPVIGSVLDGSQTADICQIVLTTATGGTGAIVTIEDVPPFDSACAAPQNIVAFQLGPGIPLVMGGNVGTLLTVPRARDFCIAAHTNPVYGLITYEFRKTN